MSVVTLVSNQAVRNASLLRRAVCRAGSTGFAATQIRSGNLGEGHAVERMLLVLLASAAALSVVIFSAVQGAADLRRRSVAISDEVVQHCSTVQVCSSQLKLRLLTRNKLQPPLYLQRGHCPTGTPRTHPGRPSLISGRRPGCFAMMADA